jgi:uncharacterized protein (TIRG00374 family)
MEVKMPVRYREFFSLNFIGYMCNIVFPARAGDILRAYWISSKACVSKGKGLASVISERIFDTLTIFIILESLIIFNKFPYWVERTGKLLGLLITTLFIILIFISKFDKWFIERFNKIFFFLPEKLKERSLLFAENILTGLKLIFRKRIFFIAFFYSIIIWFMEGASAYFIFLSLKIDIQFFVSLFSVIIANLAGLIPASPGQLGIYEASMVFALSIFGVNKEVALGSALIIHLLTYLVIIIFGVIFSWMQGWNELIIKKQIEKLEEQN